MDEKVKTAGRGASSSPEERRSRHRRETELLERIRRDDDPRAKEEFLERYRELLHRFAHKYHSDRLPYEDAFQLAALGMWKAVRRFDPSRGISFITFAYPTIEGELKKHYRDHLELIRMPRPLRELRHRVEAERRALEQAGRRPDVPLLAERLGVPEEEIIEVLAAGQTGNVFSLDYVCGEEEADTLGSLVGEHDPAFEEVERGLVLEEGLSRLPHRHRQVLEMRLRGGMTQTRIARNLRISQMHVSRLIREAVEMLATMCRSETDIA
ncbi:sigma-70 family RNA polymerase sigma factor [Candidatus Solincola tengchongensis]|uniref:sigma-70 family RNA polymerase sigma factor n=1 Tax=Candidatus Solincola tengchongensis TaxID=2900693 RepID=UPI00258077F0|nr:sigma-70 family RNA polymerase sigma factor [Candidatus Solincola tengchongensis]